MSISKLISQSVQTKYGYDISIPIPILIWKLLSVGGMETGHSYINID